VRATLQIGGLENRRRRGGSEVVQTQTAQFPRRSTSNQISRLPVGSGCSTSSSTCRREHAWRKPQLDDQRLPQSTINITIDGMSVQDNT
jgi:hypothetical protein